MPDVLAQSGARLREVGTTNRTRVSDYAAALSERTGLILRVHPSNFRIDGFAERPALEALVELGRRFKVPVVEDLGSGHVGLGPQNDALRDEPDVRASVAAGAEAVMFSGDKLLGGPQAGIVVGGTESISAVRRHPLMRAIRVDKMTYAALEATLAEHVAGRAWETVPVLAMIGLTVEAIARRAAALAARLAAAGVRVELADGHSTIGGGSAPGSALPTLLVAVDAGAGTPSLLESALRRGVPPVVARIEHDRVVLDLRTVPPAQDHLLADSGRRGAGLGIGPHRVQLPASSCPLSAPSFPAPDLPATLVVRSGLTPAPTARHRSTRCSLHERLWRGFSPARHAAPRCFVC